MRPDAAAIEATLNKLAEMPLYPPDGNEVEWSREALRQANVVIKQVRPLLADLAALVAENERLQVDYGRETTLTAQLRYERDALAAQVATLREALGVAVPAMKSGEPIHDQGLCQYCDKIRAALAATAPKERTP